MNTLITYIKAIHKLESCVTVMSQSTQTASYLDDEIEVCEEQTTYDFDNGVVLRYKTERDNGPSELICEECWISYEVVNPAGQTVSPARKTFHNACQESFWLKMQGCRGGSPI